MLTNLTKGLMTSVHGFISTMLTNTFVDNETTFIVLLLAHTLTNEWTYNCYVLTFLYAHNVSATSVTIKKLLSIDACILTLAIDSSSSYGPRVVSSRAGHTGPARDELKQIGFNTLRVERVQRLFLRTQIQLEYSRVVKLKTMYEQPIRG